LNEPPGGVDQAELLQRLLAKDASLWTDDPEEQAKIRHCPGWLPLRDTAA